MLKIYHNPRCSKSREAIRCLESFRSDFEIVLYMENPPTVEEIKQILKKLNYSPIELIRTGEAIWKENYKGKTMSDDEIIQAMIRYPQLIERPVVVGNEKAIVARPASKLKEML